jgi:hypothetical protein
MPRLFRAVCGTTEQATEKIRNSNEIDEKHPSWAKARVDSLAFDAGVKTPAYLKAEFFRRL